MNQQDVSVGSRWIVGEATPATDGTSRPTWERPQTDQRGHARTSPGGRQLSMGADEIGAALLGLVGVAVLLFWLGLVLGS